MAQTLFDIFGVFRDLMGVFHIAGLKGLDVIFDSRQTVVQCLGDMFRGKALHRGVRAAHSRQRRRGRSSLGGGTGSLSAGLSTMTAAGSANNCNGGMLSGCANAVVGAGLAAAGDGRFGEKS